MTGRWCHACLCDTRQWPLPHVCRIYDTTCLDCDLHYRGNALDVLGAQQAHARYCPGMLHPTSGTEG